MARALGIDPGTKSFDLVLLDGDKVVWEASVDTAEVARDPSVLVRAIEEAGEYDIIVGPSGYGTPVVCNEDIVDPKTFALEILLLSSEDDIEEGVARGEVGIMVYKALADVAVELWRRGLPVCYIPSVVLLPTVPVHRKLNKIDMGTADKMSVAVLGVVDQARRLGISYSETSFIVVEMGYGYNAAVAVREGRIVDGFGGTTTPTGFLTAGPLDLEVVVAGREWRRYDVFYGGVATACGEQDLEKALAKAEADPLCRAAFESMVESVVKAVRALTESNPEPREILLSGRLARVEALRRAVEERLRGVAPVTRIKGLPGASRAKEAAQGYAVVGEGLAGGVFKELVEHMGIREARGTVMDWVVHPRLREARERLRRAYLKSLRREKAEELLGLGAQHSQH